MGKLVTQLRFLLRIGSSEHDYGGLHSALLL